jgi:hypothetical protein
MFRPILLKGLSALTSLQGNGLPTERSFDRPEGRRLRRSRLGQPHRRRPRLDCLEERTLLSSYATLFQLDGDASSSYPVGATGHDWSQVYSDFTKTTTNASGTAALNFYNDPVPVSVPGVPAQTEDAFSGGNSKDINDINQWTYNSSAPQNKANLENAIAASYIDPSNNNHTYLYVGTDRYDNSGSTIIGVWFLQNPIAQANGKFWVANPDGSPSSTPETHKNGDVLLVANFGGGGSVSITSFTWNNGGIPSTGKTLDASKGVAVVNSTPLDGASGHAPPVPWPYRSSASGTAASYVQSGEFFEAGVDLNNLFGNSGPFNFSSFVVETRASTSANSTLSDLIVGHVSTAPDVAVSKVADSATVDAGSQVGFTVTVSNVGVGDLTNVTLTDNSTAGLPTTSLPLPSGAHNDILWSIDPLVGNPSDFVLDNTTTPGTQHLSLISGLNLPFDSAPISVHLIGTGSTQGDGLLDNRATVGASNEASAFTSNNQADAQITIVNAGVSTVTPQNSDEGASQTFKMGSFTSANSGTASVDVNWGDGTTHTTFTFTNTPNVAYAMPSQTHTYAEEGTYTVTEAVTLGGSTKTGTFSANVSDPNVATTATYPVTAPYTTTYNGQVVGNLSLATFTDPGGAEPNSSDSGPLDSHYSATVDWGGGFGTSTGTISFASGTFTVSALVPYITVGTYSPVVTINHELSTAQTVTDTLTVNPAPLTITADAVPATAANDVFTKVYDGHVYTGFTVRYDGFVNGETSAVLGGTLGFSGAGTTAINVGNGYVVTPGGQTSTNYDIHYVNGSLNITQALLTITADAVPGTAANDPFTKVYDGHVYTGFTVRYDGFVNGETSAVLGGTLSFSGVGTTAVNAGTGYVVTPGGQTSSNYNIHYVNGSLNITKAHLTVTADNQSYDEGIPPTDLTATITGFVNGETLGNSGVTGSPNLTTTANADGSSAPGTYSITVSQGSLAAGNYDFTIFNPGVLQVYDVAPAIVMSGSTINLAPGDTFTRPGSFSDPGTAVPSETWTMTTDYQDGSPVFTSTSPGSISVSHQYLSAGSYTVTVTIGDNYGLSTVLTFKVNVAQSPTLALSQNGKPIGTTATGQTNTPFNLTGSFTESTDTGSWVINWGDPAGTSGSNPNVQTGTVSTPGGGSGTFDGSHTYKHKGTYTVSVTSTDAFGNSVTQSFALTIS